MKGKNRFSGIGYERQEPQEEEKAYYGVEKYTVLEGEFHDDVMWLLGSEKYRSLPADAIPKIAARIHATFLLSQLKQEGKVIIVEEK